MKPRKGNAFLLIIIFIFLASIVVVGWKLYFNKIIKSSETKSSQVKSDHKWINQDYYDYLLLPNGTKAAKLLFKDTAIAQGKNVIDNLTAHYTFGNPLYDPESGVYNQSLYTKNDGVYAIKIQDFMGKKGLFFSSMNFQSNRMANLHLFDEDLLSNPEVEGVIVELDDNTILELVHYRTLETTFDDYKNDSKAFIQLLNSQ